jgi:hypothetical protein
MMVLRTRCFTRSTITRRYSQSSPNTGKQTVNPKESFLETPVAKAAAAKGVRTDWLFAATNLALYVVIPGKNFFIVASNH